MKAESMSNVSFSFLALSRMLVNPNPSLLFNCSLAIPGPLSFTSKTRLGGLDRRLTLMTVGLAWRKALLIAF